jgi:hypothetical protein
VSARFYRITGVSTRRHAATPTLPRPWAAAGGDYRIPGGQGRLRDVHAHAPAGAGDQ